MDGSIRSTPGTSLSVFGSRFLDTELHYDLGAPNGTAKAEQAIDECPIKDLRTNLETMCCECNGAVHFVRNDVHGKGTGDWMHVQESDACTKGSLNKRGKFGSPMNELLFTYLGNVEAVHGA
jgi:hypothetical protein